MGDLIPQYWGPAEFQFYQTCLEILGYNSDLTSWCRREHFFHFHFELLPPLILHSLKVQKSPNPGHPVSPVNNKNIIYKNACDTHMEGLHHFILL